MGRHQPELTCTQDRKRHSVAATKESRGVRGHSCQPTRRPPGLSERVQAVQLCVASPIADTNYTAMRDSLRWISEQRQYIYADF